MIPQGSFMVTARVRPDRVVALRGLLASMNSAPGVVDPGNSLVPFARFDTIHVARLVVIEDPTLSDRTSYPELPQTEPVLLTFLGDCDGPGDALLARLAAEAADGLRQIFAHCEGFDEGADLLAWMRAHSTPPATIYVNWIGRTVRQVREEALLHESLRRALADNRETDPWRLHAQLRAAVTAGDLSLTPLVPPTLAQKIADAVGLVSVPLLLLLLTPFAILAAPVFVLVLRRRERTDPVFSQRPDPKRVREISAWEDHDVTNPFSAIGALKPGLFRLGITRSVLRAVDWSARHIYRRGRLARVGTIHFARWVLLDGKRRLFFASNYDGSLESYMDDFINKVAFGLNLVFSNGIGYPHTDFLVMGGAQVEHQFKHFLRGHQVPTDVWYKAYPGLTAADLARNARLRAGFERVSLSDTEARHWLAEI